LRGVPEDATVTVGGRAIPPPARELAIPVLPGRVTIVVHAAGFEREELGVEVGAGRTIDVPIALRRPAPSAPPARAAPRERERGDRTVDSSPLRTTSIGLLVGAGAVALASGVLFLITGLQHGDLEACNDDLACAPSSMREDIADRGRALETASWITLGVAAVVAAAGATTLFLSRSRVGATEGREVAARAPLDLETSPDRVVLVARGALP